MSRIPTTEQCAGRAINPDDGTTLLCWLRDGHAGSHWDHAGRLSWQSGGVTTSPAETEPAS